MTQDECKEAGFASGCTEAEFDRFILQSKYYHHQREMGGEKYGYIASDRMAKALELAILLVNETDFGTKAVLYEGEPRERELKREDFTQADIEDALYIFECLYCFCERDAVMGQSAVQRLNCRAISRAQTHIRRILDEAL